ncbi:MAG: 4Fe-4S binding protein [Acidobacteriota bacterium]
MSTVTEKKTAGFDLLRLLGIRQLILWRGFPYIFQAAMLLVFASLIILGWERFAPAGVNEKLFAKTHLVTLLVWGLWWPAMVWVAVIFGRVWCSICPLELVSNFSERLGRRIGIRQRPLRRWVTSGAVIVALYALIQLLVAGADIHRVPAYTALFLLGLLVMAFITSLFFRDRAFCRGFCPVGQLLSVYGQGGMLAVRADSETCRTCTSKGCLIASNRNNLDARSCPSLLNPPKLNSNRECLICTQCIKSCEPDNMRLLLRWPFHSADTREPLANLPTTVFVMLVSGFVIWELFTEWPAAEKVFLTAPHWLSQQIGVEWLTGYLEGFWALGVVPLALWLVTGSIVKVFDNRTSLRLAWRKLALPMAVVVSAGHMAKGLAKFVSWAGFLPYAVKDPNGLDTLQGLANKTIAMPASLLSPLTSVVVAVCLLGIALGLSLREMKLSHPQTRYIYFVPPVAIAVGFLFIVVGWTFK